METVLRILQVFFAIGLIGVVLLQRSEGGGLGMGSSASASFMSVRGSANFLTRVTAILGALFMIDCLALTIIAHAPAPQQSIFDTAPAPAPIAPPPAPEPTAPPASATPPQVAPSATEPAPALTPTQPASGAADAPAAPAAAASVPAPASTPPVAKAPAKKTGAAHSNRQ